MVSVVGRAVCGRRCRSVSCMCRFDCPGRGAFIRNVPKRLFGSGCPGSCSHGCSLLLTICKNRHVPRICKNKFNEQRIFHHEHSTRRTPTDRILLSSDVFPQPGNGLRALLSRCGRCLIKEPPCNRREVGGEGRGAFGFVIGGLVYPLEIVYPEFVGIRTCQIVAQVAGSA